MLTPRRKRLRILLLCDDWPGHANAIHEHINAFKSLSRHSVRAFNPIAIRDSLALDLEAFDAVVVHYSLILCHDRYVSPQFRRKLSRYRGLKIQFIQDEYRWVDRSAAASRETGINVLFTNAEEPMAATMYDTRLPGVRRVHTLTGYAPGERQSSQRRPLAERSIDVGYRGRELPFWLGSLSQEKKSIAQGFLQRAPRYDLRVDIGWREQDRIYGDRWTEFLSSSRATLGTESGASITDFDGSAERAVTDYLRDHPEAEFNEVHEAVLQPFEGNVALNVISPRVFEAAALGTALVMFPGRYSGVLPTGEHYVVLQKDFSNMDEVVEKLKDDDHVTALAKSAYEFLIASGRWSYASFIQKFDEVVSEEASLVFRAWPAPRYRLAKVERTWRLSPPHRRVLRSMLVAAGTMIGRDFSDKSAAAVKSILYLMLLSMRAAIGDAQLRPILREGRRAGLALDGLLEEILKLSILRRAARGDGRLNTFDQFKIATVFDVSSGSLRFISKPNTPNPTGYGVPTALREAVHSGAVKSIQWDHTALGRKLRLHKPPVELVVGHDGVKDFTMIAEIGRRKPAILECALEPILGMEQAPQSPVGRAFARHGRGVPNAKRAPDEDFKVGND